MSPLSIYSRLERVKLYAWLFITCLTALTLLQFCGVGDLADVLVTTREKVVITEIGCLLGFVRSRSGTVLRDCAV